VTATVIGPAPPPAPAPPVPVASGRRPVVTVGLLGLLLAVGLATGSLPGGPSPELLQAVGAEVGRPPWVLLSSALWCAGPASYLLVALLVPPLLGSAERQLGSRVTLGALLLGQLLATGVGLLIIRVLAGTGDVWARELSAMAAVGPLPGVLAVVGLASARASALWRRRLRLSATVVLGALFLYSGSTADVLRWTGWLLGLAAGVLQRDPAASVAPAHPSRREGRALVALLVAMTAVGPLVAALSRTPDGPWAVVAHLFVTSRPPHGLLRAVCGPFGDHEDCRVLQARARLTGAGPTLLSILPVVLQLVLAEGLRRGRRAAWVGAVVFNAALAVVGGIVMLTILRTPAQELPLLDTRPGTLPAVSMTAPLMAPLAVLVLLLVTRGRFGVRAAPGAGRRWLAAASAGTVAVVATYVVLGGLPDAQFAGRPSVLTLLADLPARMLPPGYLGEVLAPLAPLHGAARLLADWGGVAEWGILLLTALRLVQPSAPPGDAVRARARVLRDGDGPLSFMATWTGNRYWFAPGDAGVVAYRVIGGVAVTTGDPIGPPSSREAAVHGFTAWCEEQGWTPCWYAVTDAVADALAQAGGHRLQVAVETRLSLGALAFTGRRWQDVRTAMNRARREGIEARWISWGSAPLALREQITRLSEEWLATKGLPEMGFTLGGLDELADDAVRSLIAVDGAGRVIALTSWLPARRAGQAVGWTLDVMRRAPDASPGVMEFLLATAALTFQDEGAEWVSLSGAPLALPPDAADRGGLTRLLELAGRTMEPVYGFRSLLAFKAKFRPEHRPLWLVYVSPADLPRIARAVSRAYLPEISPGQAARLVTALVRGHQVHPARAHALR
jgi:phosphatidylglycerol lysyltransferase